MRKKTPWKIAQTWAKSRLTGVRFLPFTSPPQDLALSVVLLCEKQREEKRDDSEPAGKLRKFKKNKNKMCACFFFVFFFLNDKLVVRLYCPLCLKWINRAVSETESQTGNQNRRLQACVASVASGFHTALICFLRLSHKWWWWLWWWCGGKEVGSVAFLRKIVV